MRDPYRMRAVLASAVALLAMAGATAAPSLTSAAGPTQPPPAPGAFRLETSNGYSMLVLAIPTYHGHPATVEIFVSGKHQGVSYSAPATVTETSIQANLGELGEISVAFHPSGQLTTAHPSCGGKSVSFDSGIYEGTIDFHGEEGYTEVEATSVPGDPAFWLNALCGVVVGGGGGGPLLPGAELHVRNPQLGPEFSVTKNRPSAPAHFEVVVSEYVNGISIKRFVAMPLPSGTFRYDRRLRTATLHPPAPFAGTGRFVRRRKAGKRWSGDLTVDMPGRAGVPLTGSALRATLVHAEWGSGGSSPALHR
jgi:hypothetical protein